MVDRLADSRWGRRRHPQLDHRVERHGRRHEWHAAHPGHVRQGWSPDRCAEAAGLPVDDGGRRRPALRQGRLDGPALCSNGSVLMTMRAHRSREAGYLLIEVLITMFILAIGL